MMNSLAPKFRLPSGSLIFALKDGFADALPSCSSSLRCLAPTTAQRWLSSSAGSQEPPSGKPEDSTSPSGGPRRGGSLMEKLEKVTESKNSKRPSLKDLISRNDSSNPNKKNDSRAQAADVTRVSLAKIWYPGQRYQPSDFSKIGNERIPEERPKRGKRIPLSVLDSELDFRNVEFLEQFVNPLGRIKHRRLTNIPARYQRKAAKKIKLARQMALLPFENTWNEVLDARHAPPPSPYDSNDDSDDDYNNDDDSDDDSDEDDDSDDYSDDDYSDDDSDEDDNSSGPGR